MSLTRRQFLSASALASLMPMSFWSDSAKAEETSLAFQAAWINDAEFTGYFIAILNGYYKDNGLSIDYLSGGPDVIPESSLIAGKADIALTTPDTTIKAILEQGAKFKIIGTQYQKNPLGIVSKASAPIKTPQELEGKVLAVPPVNILSVEAMLALNKVDKNKVKIVPYAYDPTPLIKGEIDASLDFTTNVPFTLKQQGVEAHSFLLYDFGYKVFNDTVVVTEETLKNKRKELVAWLKASRQGWEENFKDPAAYPPKFAETWFKGTGRSIENEIFFNTAQQALMESKKGYFAMSEEDITANIESLKSIGINATRDMFDTTLLGEI